MDQDVEGDRPWYEVTGGATSVSSAPLPPLGQPQRKKPSVLVQSIRSLAEPGTRSDTPLSTSEVLERTARNTANPSRGTLGGFTSSSTPYLESPGLPIGDASGLTSPGVFIARHVDSTGQRILGEGGITPSMYSPGDETPSTAQGDFGPLTESLLAEELVRKAGHRLRVPKMMRSEPLPAADAAQKESDDIGGSIPLEFAVFAFGLLAILATVVGLYVAISRGVIEPPTRAHYDSFYAKQGDPSFVKEL